MRKRKRRTKDNIYGTRPPPDGGSIEEEDIVIGVLPPTGRHPTPPGAPPPEDTTISNRVIVSQPSDLNQNSSSLMEQSGTERNSTANTTSQEMFYVNTQNRGQLRPMSSLIYNNVEPGTSQDNSTFENDTASSSESEPDFETVPDLTSFKAKKGSQIRIH